MRKRFNGKQIIALALALTMVVSEVGVVQATSATEQVVEVASEESTEVSEALEGTSEEALEAQEALKEEAAQEVTQLQKPGQVTNLRLDTEAVDGVKDNAVLSWDSIQEADGYEIKVTDANGLEYLSNSYYGELTELNYDDVSSPCDLREALSGLYGYKLADGKYTLATETVNEVEREVRIKEGVTYKVYIRAYNEGEITVTDAAGVKTQEDTIVYGDWSAEWSYTTPSITKLEKVSDVKLVEKTDETSYLSFNYGNNDYAEVEIKDAAGKDYYGSATVKDGVLVGDYVDSYGYLNLDYKTVAYQYELKEENGNKYATQVQVETQNADGTTTKTPVSAFAPGQTYTLRVRGVVEVDGKPTYSEWSEPVTYTCADVPAPEQPGQLEIDYEDNDVTWNSAEYASGYEVELKDANGTWYTSYPKWDSETGKYVIENITRTRNSLTLNNYATYKLNEDASNYESVKDAEGNTIYAGKAGTTYTVRVRAYNTKKDGETKQYSDWSSTLTVAMPAEETFVAPTKVEGVRVTESGNISWTEEKNADNTANGTTYYQVEVKDGNGREYYANRGTVLDKNGNITSYKLYTETTGTSMYAGGLRTYTTVDGVPQPVIHSDTGYAVTAFEAGQTYSVRVRAYRYKKDATGEYYQNTNGNIQKLTKDETYYYDANGNALIRDAAGDYYQNSTRVTVEADGFWYTDYANKKYKLIKGANGDYYYDSDETSDSEDDYVYVLYSVTDRIYSVVYGDWSDVENCAVSVDHVSTGINAKPAQVTGVWIKTEPEEDETLNGPIMYWNGIENVDRYEFEIKDSKGNLYSYYNYVNDTYMVNYPSYGYNGRYPEMSLDYIAGIQSFSKPEGSAWVTLKNADGTDAMTFQAGETYTIRVRAVNRYREYDAVAEEYKAAVEFQGDWSEPVTYTPAKNASAVTGLALARTDEDYYYFTYNADVVDSQIYYQIATDNEFDSASIVKNWSVPNGDDVKLAIPKDADYLNPSTTYYVRVVNNTYSVAPNATMEKSQYNAILATAAVTSFTTEAEEVKAPKNITGLKVYKENTYNYELRFDAVLEVGEDYYEIQIATNPNSSNWAVLQDGYCTISKSDLSAGTNYIRAVAYIYKTDEITGKTEKVYGTPSNVVTINNDDYATSPIGTVKMAEEENWYYYFTYSGNLHKEENVQVWYSESKNFETNDTVDTYVFTNSYSVNKKVSIYKGSLKPGKTYYVKMRTYNSKGKTTAEKYSAFSNVVKVKTTIPNVYVSDSSVTKNSITLTMANSYESGWVKGYEVQRKSVKKKKTTWTTIGKSSASTYTDKKLKADTTYTYRVRPYYFDEETNETVNGSWTYFEAMTGFSGSLKLQAKAASKTSIKLTWTKISGAQGYEIYRYVTSSNDTQISNGYGNAYAKYKQIAKVSSKKKSYTDKKLTAGMGYSYLVKAYKTVGGKKVYIEGYDWASLDFELIKVNQVEKANGKETLTWNPVYSAKGYLIEKQDPITGKWSTYKKIKKAKTSSYTFPATKDMENGDYYRIRAYKGTKYTNALYVSVDPVLAAPTKVKAKATANGIQISWKAVKGADYYRVYRTTSPVTVYNKDTKTYSYETGIEVGRYIADSSTVTGYRERDLEEMNVTSVMDQKIVYSYNGIDNQTYYAGPDTGVKYYYYVIAYKNRPQNQYIMDNDEAYEDKEYYTSGYSKAASATIKETKPAKSSITKASSKKKTVTLTLKASANADGYEIARSTKKKKGYTVIGTVNDPDTLTYKDKYNKKKNKLKKGKTYYYKVRSFKYNDDGSKVYSAYSSPKKVKVK